jgi:2-polyprenyl-6-methoxyphenol hydroxylase-like FAD-dependent oxidoreductase
VHVYHEFNLFFLHMAGKVSQQQPFIAGKKIIIAGAGIAGLAFAISLRKQWPASSASPESSNNPPTIIIFERDIKQSAIDREGYSLSIRGDPFSGGMQALHKLGLLEPMLRASLTGVGDKKSGFAIWDKDWNEILKLKPKPSDPNLPVSSMRIARKALRQIMIGAVSPDDIIHWGVSCTSAAQLENGKVQVQLSNGDTQECDLLIAADGANSKIRNILRPNDKLSFAGAVCIAGQATFPNGIPAPVDRDWGTVIGAGGVSLFASPVDDQHAIWSLSYLSNEPRERLPAPLSEEQAEKLKQEVLELGAAIGSPFDTLVRATDSSALSITNAKDKNPFGHVGADRTCGGVIFIGDSNHAMSSFAGNGANMALMDGWELAEQLCKPGSLHAALTAYDSSSMPRSKSAIRMSHRTITMAHAQGWRLAFYMVLLRIMKFFLFGRD